MKMKKVWIVLGLSIMSLCIMIPTISTVKSENTRVNNYNKHNLTDQDHLINSDVRRGIYDSEGRKLD